MLRPFEIFCSVLSLICIYFNHLNRQKKFLSKFNTIMFYFVLKDSIEVSFENEFIE